MKYLDRFLNTYEKRVFALYVLILVILLYLGINAIALGSQLTRVTNIETLYSLASFSNVENTLVGRVIVGYLLYNNLPNGIVRMLGYAFSFWHLLLMLFCLLLFTCGEVNAANKSGRNHILAVLIVQLVLTLVILVGCVIITQSTTTALAIEKVHLLGMGYLVAQTLVLITNLIIPFVLLSKYRGN